MPLADDIINAYRQREQDIQQRPMRDLAQAHGLMQVLGAQQQLQERAPIPLGEIQGMLANSGLPPEKQAMIQTLIAHPATRAMALSQLQREMAMANVFGPQGATPGVAQMPPGPGGAVPASPSGTPPMAPPAAGTAPNLIQIQRAILSGDPSLKAWGEAMLGAMKGIAARPNAPIVNPITGQIVAQPTPAPPAGGAIRITPTGPEAYPIPNAAPIAANQAAAVAGGTEFGKAPYEVQTLNTEGAPTAMTRQQIIEQATGQPMPRPGMPAATPLLPGERIISELNNGRTARTVMPGAYNTPEERAAFEQVLNAAQGGRTSSAVPGLRLQDQGAGAEQRKVGEQLGEYVGGIQASASKAVMANRVLDNMNLAAKDIALGKLAPTQSWLTQWAQSAGIKVPEEAKKAAGSTQALESMAIKMAGEATRQSDAQPSQLQYFNILKSMPSVERSPEGFLRITAYIRDLNNYNIAKHAALQKWRSDNGSANGFEAAWPAMADKLPLVWNQQRLSGSLPKEPANRRQAVDEALRKYGGG